MFGICSQIGISFGQEMAFEEKAFLGIGQKARVEGVSACRPVCRRLTVVSVVRYWVCLKGTTLLFYNCESRDGHSIEASPKHLIFVDNCLLQSIPEHPKRDHVFCLSTAFGDAYLLDAPCLAERDSWIAAIHSACAAQMARNSGESGRQSRALGRDQSSRATDRG